MFLINVNLSPKSADEISYMWNRAQSQGSLLSSAANKFPYLITAIFYKYSFFLDFPYNKNINYFLGISLFSIKNSDYTYVLKIFSASEP